MCKSFYFKVNFFPYTDIFVIAKSQRKNVKLLFETFSLLNLKPMEDMKKISEKCL